MTAVTYGTARINLATYARLQHRRDAVLTALRDADGFPLSTSQIGDAAGGYSAEEVRRDLALFALNGDVEQVRVDTTRTLYWRSTR